MLTVRTCYKSFMKILRKIFGHSFIAEDDVEKHETLSSDSNIQEVVDVEPIDEVEFVDKVDVLPRKQKFFNLDDVLNEENYDVLPEQEPSQFHYTDSKRQFTMNWHTAKQYQSGRAPSRNVLRHQPGPRLAARIVINPLEAFSLFITGDILNTMVDYISANIERFRLKFREVFEQLDKYIHCKTTDLIELKAFIGILYLRASMKINFKSGYDIWYHEC